MSLDCSDLGEMDAFLRDVFPATGKHASMEYVSCATRGKTLTVVIRLSTWDVDDDGERTIQDIKEQEVGFTSTATQRERFRACVEAWIDVLTRVFDGDDALDHLETLMPHDLVKSDVLALKTAHTKDDFVKAFLQRSRLGGWLSSASASASASTTRDVVEVKAEPRRRDESL